MVRHAPSVGDYAPSVGDYAPSVGDYAATSPEDGGGK